MKRLRIKAYHTEQKRMFFVNGIVGLIDGQLQVITKEATFSADKAEILLGSGRKDGSNQEIFDQDIVGYTLEEKGKKPELIIGWIQFEDGCFKLCYEREVYKAEAFVKFEMIKLYKWDAKECKVVGDRFKDGQLLAKKKPEPEQETEK